MIRYALTVFLLTFIMNPFAGAQSDATELPKAVETYLQDRKEDWGLTVEDLDEFAVKDDYISSSSGARHIYLVQQYRGIEVYNALITLTLKPDGEVLAAFSRFIPEVETKIKGERATLPPVRAIVHSFRDLKQEVSEADFSHHRSREGTEIYRAEHLSRTEIPVKLVYQPTPEGKLELAYDLSFDPTGDMDYWSYRVSAIDGEVLDRVNWTVYCNTDKIPQHQHSESCFHSPESSTEFQFGQKLKEDRRHSHTRESGSRGGLEESSYRVVPFPYESPIHGDFEMVHSPADPEYSPLGWHSISEAEGPDFTHTRGNNVHAFLDRLANGSPDITVDGGSDLIFDFPFDQELEPQEYAQSAVTNLFYWNNILHDFSYAYGFDEASGNFQEVNLSGEGLGEDPIRARAQFGADAGNNFTNNATFSSPPDGSAGRMSMYVWTDPTISHHVLNVDAPSEIAGQYPSAGAQFGNPITEVAITGYGVLVDDGVGVPTDGCEEILNQSEIEGNIAIIDRGNCEFGQKVLNAELNGAIAVIICNNRSTGNLNSMAPGSVGHQVSIPSVFISQNNCDLIRQYAGEELVIRLQREVSDGANHYDSSLDNGIIAHEYAHGISIRLTGGPGSSNCLVNSSSGDRLDGQQMGEGWSDFFSLITGIRPGDDKNTNRGIGNYVLRLGTAARGIRSYPYNYNMAANPVTYYDTYDASVPHGVGHVWGSVLWDLLWEMVEVHGFDEDWYRGEGGNNKAVQLVMDGMKIQPCNPGFMDGRDAILLADQLLYDGANQCLIWSVFARRGMGVNALQGSPFQVRDARECYEIPVDCKSEILLSKEVPGNIHAGDPIEVTLTISNYKDHTVSELEIQDDIPFGAKVDKLSIPPASKTEGGQLTITLDQLEPGESRSFTYTLLTDEALHSTPIEKIKHEEGETHRWETESEIGTHAFELIETDAFDSDRAWFVPNTSNTNIQRLNNMEAIAVQGSQPVMRIAHRYHTESGTDGGLMTASTGGHGQFEDLGYAMFRNEYPNRIAGGTFSQAGLKAFSGESPDWKQTYIDLSDYNNSDLLLSFLFGSDNNVGIEGWYIGQIEVFDAFSYHSKASVYAAGELKAEAYAPGRGTIVEPQTPVSTVPEPSSAKQLSLYPNPAGNSIHLNLQDFDPGEAEVVVSDVSGRIVWTGNIPITSAQQHEKLDISELTSGLYILSLTAESQRFTARFVKH